ncbi:MAG: BamA/TamA family outer membrane protein [Lentimicrobium sp.]|nr:BamA/TamA family outer membrane protein [Lentimicrobium sp.]
MHKRPDLKVHLLSITLLLALLSGCTGLKSVGDGRHLYSGQVMEIDSVQFLDDSSEAKEELYGLISEKPNKKFLWMRPALSLYNILPEPKKETGFRHWLKYTMGKPPVFIEDINLPNTTLAIENRLQNRGNFNARASFAVVEKAKTAEVKFSVSPGKPYTLRTIHYPDTLEQGINSDIGTLLPGSLIKKGKPYNLKDFENERIRIDGLLKEKGYYYFKPDYLLFTADTAIGEHKINSWLKVKPGIPAEAPIAFRLNNIYIFDDYSLGSSKPDTVKIGNYFYVSEKHLFKPQTILGVVFLEKDSLYSRTDHYNTLRNLMGIGVYKYANARFKPDDSLTGRMNVNLFLTPVKKISLSAEMSAAIKSNNFAGPGLNLIYKNRNLFAGAELLTLSLGGSFETQVSGESKGQTSYQVNLDGSLALPRFVPSILGRKTSRTYVPKTIFAGGFGIYSRVNLYKMNSFNSSIGYSWRRNERISHLFRAIEASFTNLTETTAEFEDYLNENPTVRKSFEEQFIVGGSYTFVNSNFHFNSRKHVFYLSESIDLAGNLLSLVTRFTEESWATAENQHKIFGLPYSQFINLRSEFRYLLNLNRKSQIAWRFIGGAALPYGNSTTIPYIRQYYVGGTNSIRAFIARSLGPGTYSSTDSLNNSYIDQAGDIKLETSIEYRFDIYKYFKGAVFADAGNIWLVNEDPQRPGGKFNPNTFYKEIAVGSGLGFRFDFKIIVLRIDLAFKLRKPYLPEGERWVFNDLDLGSKSWRRENILWNIAIGYPF